MFGTDISQELIIKFVKFCVVGAAGTLVDFGLTYLFKEKLKFSKYVANSLGFFIAASFNFYFNRIFTFQSQDTEVLIQYFKFLSVAIIGMGINTFILYLAQKYLKQKFYVAKATATAVTLIWNFFGNRMFTFK